MTDAQKLSYLKTILFHSDSDTSHDTELGVYLTLTAQEILWWKYSLVGGVPDGLTDVPPAEEVTQIMACAAGYGHQGAPDQLAHNENGISREWKHADMAQYVHENVIAYCGIPG